MQGRRKPLEGTLEGDGRGVASMSAWGGKKKKKDYRRHLGHKRHHVSHKEFCLSV